MFYEIYNRVSGHAIALTFRRTIATGKGIEHR